MIFSCLASLTLKTTFYTGWFSVPEILKYSFLLCNSFREPSDKMSRILLYDWLPERGKMLLCCPLGTTRRLTHENNVIRNPYPGVLFPHNKSFIDQACSFKMAGYWLRSYFYVLMVPDSVSAINMQKVKNELAWLILCHLDL